MERQTSFTFGDKYRYFILLLGWVCLASVSSNMIALNFTLICMSPAVSNASIIPIVDNYSTFNYGSFEKNSLMWTVALGTFIGTMPYSYLYSQHGAKYVFFGAGLVSGFVTFLIPFAARTSFSLFLAIRFVQGICYAADFAAMGMIVSRWASLKQNALFISVLTCYSPLSSSITNSLSGVLCESSFGWQSVYYGHALVSLILFSLWIYFYTDHPSTSQFVSDVELEKINRNKSESHISMERFVPWKAILNSPVVWVVWLNAFADLFSGMFLLMYLPSYLKYVMNYPIEQVGILTSIATFSHMPLKITFGYVSDKCNCLPERQKMILFNSIAVICPACVYGTIGFIPDEHKTVIVFMFTLVHMFFSTAGGGFYKCGTLVSRQYSHLIIANIQFVKCLTLFLGPCLMAIFVIDETDKTQWRQIFILLSTMLVVANTFFIKFATDEPAPFTLITQKQKNEKEAKKALLSNNNQTSTKDLAEVAE
ncbi:Major facilitator superfamily transporter [Aphelenchoides bicaudatus]|nr:Major facilitator superfamily transporter [Aphelenchoides bicaudatus]